MVAPHHSSEVILIPKTLTGSKHLQDIVERYKGLRLHGLKVDPRSFSSTYERESQFTYEIWRSRIQSPLGKTFVSVIDPDQDSDVSCGKTIPTVKDTSSLLRLLRKDWVGIVTLVGPTLFSKEDLDTGTVPSKPWEVYMKDGEYNIPLTAPETEDLSGSHVVYLVVAMFVSPEARHKGNGRRLMEAVLGSAREEVKERGISKASVTLQVDSGNDNAQRLYESVGFKVEDSNLQMKNRRGEMTNAASLVLEIECNN